MFLIILLAVLMVVNAAFVVGDIVTDSVNWITVGNVIAIAALVFAIGLTVQNRSYR